MTGNDYQQLAARTINRNLDLTDLTFHALCGLGSEVGEIQSIFQHALQEEEGVIDRDALTKEAGDALWFLAELCTVYEIDLDCVMQKNIDKLIKRYPQGFDKVRSANRHEIDAAEGE